jgi:hypothetical protein
LWDHFDSVAPMVSSLASITNDNEAINAGWAVDEVIPEFVGQPLEVRLNCALAVRDIDGFILRLASNVTVLGNARL